MVQKQTKKEKRVFWAVIATFVVAALVPIGIIVARQASLGKIDSFEACKEAKGEVMESYPEQCAINGKTFTNQAQQPGGEYIGLTEQEALDKASQENVTARIVEREGESLPVTMDFSFGRHNFSIKDGKVYKVEIEGQGMDMPLHE